MKKQDKHTQTIQHPLFGISLINWLQIIIKNGGIDTPYLQRAFFITITSLLTLPARILFTLKYSKKIQKTSIIHPPVFIIGHWRSGTTYLHELMSYDPQFSYISLWHTLLPNSFLILDPLKELLSQFLPKERPMDAIKVEADGPYEEEAGIAVLNPWSFFHGLHFPRNAEEQYQKSMHFHDMTEQEKNRWKKTYHTFIQSITYANNGKPLILKNPPNTTRIQILLDLYPNARFIHIYRNPYKVYLSTKKMRTRVLDKLALQKSSPEELDKQIINNYIRVMNTYFEQKNLIPKNQLVEIRYEDLVTEPEKQVNKIYTTLNLPGLDIALHEMRKYLKKQENYKVNVYKIDDKIIKHVQNNWEFTITKWGYSPPE
jgi:hypothetical protein